jgi:hypothetical protein
MFSTGTYSSPFCFEIFLASSIVTTNSFDALIPPELPVTAGIFFNSFSMDNFIDFKSNPAGASNNDAVSSSSIIPLNKCTGAIADDFASSLKPAPNLIFLLIVL